MRSYSAVFATVSGSD